MRAHVKLWQEAWLGKRYPHCACDLSLPRVNRCTRQIARCNSRANWFCELRKEKSK